MEHRGGNVYRFGPFELDTAARSLTRGRVSIVIPDRHLQLLIVLVSNDRRIASKEQLRLAVWGDTPVGDSTIERAIWDVRKTLGRQPDKTKYIETFARQGYRFAAPVTCVGPSRPALAMEAVLAPSRAIVDGRTALMTLDVASIAQAVPMLEAAVRAIPDEAALHIQLAMAYAIRFESTREDAAPDRAALGPAMEHAHEGVRLARASGEAWSALAFVLAVAGTRRDAIAAGQQAVTLEPDNWRHWVRLGYVSAGEERLRAVRRALELFHDLALAHWLAATVFVARQACGAALQHLRAGCAAQDAQPNDGGALAANGLHLLIGLVLAAQGDLEGALEECRRELAAAPKGQLYGRECFANTWYSIGAVRRRLGRLDEAREAFHTALTYVPGHARTNAVLAACDGAACAAAPCPDRDPVNAAIVTAVSLACADRHEDAAAVVLAALEHAEPGSAGWQLSIEPVLNVSARPDVWARALAAVRHRAG